MNSPACIYLVLVSAAVAIGFKKSYQKALQAAHFGCLAVQGVIVSYCQTTIKLGGQASLSGKIGVKWLKSPLVPIDNDRNSIPNNNILTSPLFVLTHNPRQPDGYRAVKVQCGDCTNRGTEVKRLFWK